VRPLLLLAAFLAWQAWEVASYARQDTRPPSWDQAIHMEIALDYKRALAAGRWRDAWTLPPKPGMPPFPPVYHSTLIPAYGSADPAGSALWVNWAYLVLLCAALCSIARRFAGGWAPVWAALAFGAAPAVQQLLFTQLVDLPLIACVALNYAALFAADGFRSRRGSILTGLAFAFGMLHKWSFFTYMIPLYVLAVRALFQKKTARHALESAGLAALISAPWYLYHWPIMVPRLFQASSDMGTPMSAREIGRYLLQTAEGLNPVAWALGLAGLAWGLRRRSAAWRLLGGWLASSCAFWALVPNHQLRFLAPGLAPIALGLACAPWPRGVVWSALALQLVLAANFVWARWDSKLVPFPIQRIGVLLNSPAKAEDWKVEAILADAAREARPPISNLTLVANDEYFNGPGFTWLAKLTAPGVSVRGVNRRLCELSRFVVLKTGSLGPPTVIEGLGGASDAIRDPRGWFARAFEERRRYPLPDGSEAILYVQRRLEKPPYPVGKKVFKDFSVGRFSAKNLAVSFEGWRAADSSYRSITVEAPELSLNGLRVTGVRLRLEDALAVPVDLKEPWKDLRLLKIGALRVESLRVAQGDVEALLAQRARDLKGAAARIDGDVAVTGRLRGVPVSARAAARLASSPRALILEAESLKAAGIPLPLFLLPAFKRVAVSFEPNPETPFPIELPGLTLARGELSVP
jgi:hypothetical protein